MESNLNTQSEWGWEINNEDGDYLFSGFSDMVEEGSVLSGEAMIGLKLGRRTERQEKSGTDAKGFVPDGLYSSVKRSRGSQHSSVLSRCQVEGCNLDLASAKDYHRRHRICVDHSKSPTVVVAGMERRFCQQCSRLHDLSEFDDRKRSCRRRLSAHNARRRRPHSEDIKLGSTRLFRTSTLQSSSNFKGGCIDMMSNGGLSDISSSFGGITPSRLNHDGLEADHSSINSMEVHHSFSAWGFRGHQEPSSFNQFMHGHEIGLMQPGMLLKMQSARNTHIPLDFDCFYSN